MSCNRLIALVTQYAQKNRLNMRILKRENDAQEFENNNIVACPATRLDGRLLFYGEFSEEMLDTYIHPVERVRELQQPNQEEVKMRRFSFLTALTAGSLAQW
jgi:Thioredoxin domain